MRGQRHARAARTDLWDGMKARVRAMRWVGGTDERARVQVCTNVSRTCDCVGGRGNNGERSLANAHVGAARRIRMCGSDRVVDVSIIHSIHVVS